MFDVPHRSWSILLQTVSGASRSLFLCSVFCLLASPALHAIVDANDNGASDLWELRYNSGTLYPTFDPNADPDGDGWTNAQEAVTGTDPADANPPIGFLRPEITHYPAVYLSPEEEGDPPILISPAIASIEWPTLAGKQYTLFSSTDLSPGSWNQVDQPRIGSTSILGTNITLTQPDGSVPASLFLRVSVLDTDSDDDGLTNHEEDQLGINPSSPDSDGDGLTDKQEGEIGTDPSNADTDGDGASDGIEVAAGSDPKSAASVPSADPFVFSEIKKLTAQQATVEAFPIYGYSSWYSYQHWPYIDGNGTDEVLSFFTAAIAPTTVHSALLSYTYRPISNESHLRLPQGLGWGTPDFSENGGYVYGPSLGVLALSHDIWNPYGPDSPSPARVITNFGMKLRLENKWNCTQDVSYSYVKVHLKAPMPTGSMPQYSTPDTYYWTIPGTNYTLVNADTEVIELKIPKGAKISPEYELEPPIVEAGMCHLVTLVSPEVSWKPIDGWDNVSPHIDPWTNKENGNRIFPCFKDPDDTELRAKLQVVVKTSPALVGKTVYVKAFDVDDSTSETFDKDDDPNSPTNGDAVIDTEGKAGNDNLPDYLNTQLGGQFWNETTSAWGGQAATGVVDANGETKFDFRVGMQPGNNYRVVASVNNEAMYDGVQTADPSADKYLGPEFYQNGEAPASPLLTVWRRLWVENDSMGVALSNGSVVGIPTDVHSNKLNDLHGTTQVPTILGRSYRHADNLTEFEIPEPSDRSSFQLLENGNLKIQGQLHPVITTAATWPYDEFNPQKYYVSIQGNHSGLPVGSGFRLYDDDDYGLNSNALPRLDLVSKIFKSRFYSSFIESIDAKQFNHNKYIPFALNKTVHGSVINLDTFWEQSSDLEDKNACWVGRLVAAYQDKYSDDVDPWEGEGLSEGLTPGFRRNFCAIYVETIRDEFGTMISNPNSMSAGLESIELGISLNSAHEISHMAGFEPTSTHHAEAGLMAEQIDVNIGSPAKFTARSVKRMRKTTKWQKP